MQRKWQHSSTSGMLWSWGHEGEKKPGLKNTKDSCLCSREHREYGSLTNRSIVWHSLQFLHNINVQQLKGQQILQEETPHSFHEQTLKLNHICPWQHRSHWCTNNTLFLNTTSEGSFPTTYIYVIEYGAQIRAVRDKAKNPVVRGQRKTQCWLFFENLNLSCTYLPHNDSPWYQFEKTALLFKMQYTLSEKSGHFYSSEALFLQMSTYRDIKPKMVCFLATWILVLYLCSEEIDRWDIKFSLTWQVFDL